MLKALNFYPVNGSVCTWISFSTSLEVYDPVVILQALQQYEMSYKETPAYPYKKFKHIFQVVYTLEEYPIAEAQETVP